MPRRRVDSRKLHAKLAEIDNLKIYRVRHYPGIGPKRGGSRCIACATEPRSMVARMKDPDNTTGRPIGIGYWLVNTDTQEVMGPFGKECGFRAVMNSWLKPRREAMRQQLLAAGVPSSEIEERLQQFAHDEWNRMLRVYMKAEREAKKLKIDTTTLTYDEIVAAIEDEKKKIKLENATRTAKFEGLDVQPSVNRTFFVDGKLCETAEDVYALIDAAREKRDEERRKKAEEARRQNQAKYKDHVEFIEWALSSGQNFTASELRSLETGLMYINQGNPFPQTLRGIENLAVKARQWGWTGYLGQVSVPPPQPVGSTSSAGGKAPICPKCGGELIHKQGYSYRKQKSYNFWSCKRYPNCDGALNDREYNRQLLLLNPQQFQQPTQYPQPQQTVQAPKAVAAAQAQAQQSNPYTSKATCSSCGKMYKLCRCGGVGALAHPRAGVVIDPDTMAEAPCPDPNCKICEMLREQEEKATEPSTAPLEEEVEKKRTMKAKEAFKERQKKSYWKM